MARDDRVKRARSGGPAEAAGKYLQELLSGLAARKGVKHAIIAVESGDGSFGWMGATGEANREGAPMRTDTPFFLASVTKLYTAAVVLKLHERSQLGLDEPIGAYLPQTLIEGLHRLDGVDNSGAITVRHLLGHTSGLPDYFEERPKGGRSMAERLFREGDLAWSVEDVVRIVRDQLTPRFPPQPLDARRQRARYSDTNYQLLGAIVEAVSAEPLHRVFEELLFLPLDLRRSYLYGRSRPLEPIPEPAALWLGGQPLDLPLAMASMGPDGGIVATAEDALTFLRALARGEVFDDPATLDLMQAHWNRFGFSLDPAALRTPGWPIEYGLGMMRFRLPRLFTPLRAMPAVVGHTGSSGSWLFRCPRLDLLLAGTVDEASSGALPYKFVPRLLRVLEPAAR